MDVKNLQSSPAHYGPALYAAAKEKVSPVIGAFKMETLTILVENIANGMPKS